MTASSAETVLDEVDNYVHICIYTHTCVCIVILIYWYINILINLLIYLNINISQQPSLGGRRDTTKGQGGEGRGRKRDAWREIRACTGAMRGYVAHSDGGWAGRGKLRLRQRIFLTR